MSYPIRNFGKMLKCYSLLIHKNSNRFISSSIIKNGINNSDSGNNSHHSNNTDKNKEVCYCVSGFMRFASRKDLNFALDDLNPIQVDPILDHNSFPVGKFLIILEDESQVQILKSNITNKMSKRLQITPISSKQLNAFNTANKKGISGKTVRLRNISSNITESDLRYYFDGFKIEEKGFRKILENARLGINESSKTKSYNLKFNNQYLVDFESEYEAERAVREKNFGMLEGSILQMYCYQF